MKNQLKKFTDSTVKVLNKKQISKVSGGGDFVVIIPWGEKNDKKTNSNS